MPLDGQAEEVVGPRVLMAQDNQPAPRRLASYLSDNGFKVAVADRQALVEAAIDAGPVDLVVLDLDLKGGEGLAFCRRLAGPTTPLIVALGTFSDPAERIVALECGADDCLAKPVNPRELLARTRAVLRRRGVVPPRPLAEPRHCRFAGFDLDLAERRLTDPQGRIIDLSQAEYILLLAFLEQPRAVLGRDRLRQRLGEQAAQASDRMVDVRVKRLRSKLGGAGAALIRSIRGGGYELNATVQRL
jgi:two-component system, OmpR family, response regulator